jgi:hypothetical protein
MLKMAHVRFELRAKLEGLRTMREEARREAQIFVATR